MRSPCDRVRSIAYYSLRQLAAQQKLIDSVFELSSESTKISEVIAVLKRKNSCEALNQACVCSQSVLNTAIRWENNALFEQVQNFDFKRIEIS